MPAVCHAAIAQEKTMDVIYDLFSLKSMAPDNAPHAVTIGNFDGVHAGHVHLIARTCEKAAALGIAAAAVTFDPHPLWLLTGARIPQRITSLPHKLTLLGNLGLNRVFVLSFTHSIAALSPEEFIRSILMEGLNMRALVIGYDYALGKGRSGNHAALATIGSRLGFAVEQVEQVFINKSPVSSSRIRSLLEDGKVEELPELLGRFHSVDGTVVHGHGRGAQLGFPTANIEVEDMTLPMPGVYATYAEIAPARGNGRKAFAGVANIGANPTFCGTAISLETHLLDFAQEIYGMSMRLHFVARLRNEQRFETPLKLQLQIAKDIAVARRILEANPFP